MILPAAILEAIRAHAEEEYPRECCGLLIGRREPEAVVTAARRARNRYGKRVRDRFEMDPHDFLQAEAEAARAAAEILGFYHSHPDHPAWPSPSDLLQARPWPGYFHLIVAVRAEGFQKQARVWQVTEDGESFMEEELRAL
jgi:proteasome lid subunit RPN8/RPN11